MYFEFNLPEKAPTYVHISARKRITEILQKVISRMNRLEEALNLSGLRGEQFAAAAKILFDVSANDDKPLLDTMSTSEIVEYAKKIGPTLKVEPRMEWGDAVTVVDTAFLTTHEWEAIRVLGIGGSDAAVTMNISPYRTELELYHDKIGTPIKFQLPDNNINFIFDFGHKIEPLVISTFCNRTGAKVVPETRMFCRKDMPFITANIDAIVKMPDGRIFVFEAKTTTHFNKEAWAGTKVPKQYVPQCRQYLSVLNDPRIAGTYIGCIYGNTPADFVCNYIERNLTAEQEQLEIEKYFWDEYVLKNIEPEFSEIPEKDIKLIRKLTGPAEPDKTPMTLNQSDESLIKKYLELDAEQKLYKKRADNLKALKDALVVPIIQELSTNTKGRLAATDSENEFYEVSYSPRSKTSVDMEKLKLAYPEVYNDVVTTIPEASRVFSIKKKSSRKN